MEWLSLDTLVGRALVVEIYGSNVTAQALQALQLPPGVERLLFKTDNTAKGLLHRAAFDPTYTAVTPDGASWLAAHASIKLVGIDYLSIASYADPGEPHRILFRKNIIAVEGLVLTQVAAGWYHMTCAPLLLLGAEGAPARCFLQPDADKAAGGSGRSSAASGTCSAA